MRAFVLTMLALAAAAGPALAQTERLPLTSRSEAYINNANRSLALQQQLRSQSQQTQFEINQLRGDVQRSQQFPPMVGPGTVGGCMPGTARC
jgi:TolA-binding protein